MREPDESTPLHEVVRALVRESRERGYVLAVAYGVALVALFLSIIGVAR